MFRKVTIITDCSTGRLTEGNCNDSEEVEWIIDWLFFDKKGVAQNRLMNLACWEKGKIFSPDSIAIE